MRETVQGPGISSSDTQDVRVGGLVHQLLVLAATLHPDASETSETPDTSGAPEGAAPHAGSSFPDCGAPGVGLLVDVGGYSDAACVAVAQDVEALGRVVQGLGVQLAGELAQRVAAGRFAETGARGAVGLLVQALRLSAREAAKRVRLAGQVLPVPDGISGQLAPAGHPLVGQELFEGVISQEQAGMVLGFVEEADRLVRDGRITAEVGAAVEQDLLAAATEHDPDFMRQLGNRIMSLIDPDGNKPSASDLLARQGLFFRKARRGLVGIYGACTIEQYEQLMAAIGSETNPNTHKDINNSNRTDTSADDKDDNTSSSAGAGGRTLGDANTGAGGAGGAGGAAGSSGGGAGGVDGQGSLLERLQDMAKLFTPTPDNDDYGIGGSGGEERPQGPDGDQDDSLPAPDGEGPPPATPAHDPVPPDTRPPQPCPPDTRPPGGLPDGSGASGGVPGWSESWHEGPGTGWRRRLEAWEIPPRPPEAPETAVPPVYEGEDWFWFGPQPTSAGLWAPPTRGDFNIWEEDPPAPRPPSPWVRGPSRTTTPEQTAGTDSAPTPDPPAGQDQAQGWGFGPGWDGGRLGEPGQDQHDDVNAEPWPRLVAGTWVPAPGSEQSMPGLDSTDPTSTDPATKDTRTHGQKVLDGLLACVKLAARTGTLPINGGLKTQLIISCSETDLHRKDQCGTAYTTHSGPMPLNLFQESLCDPEITRFTYGTGRTIINAGRTQRLFTPTQRKLLYARDLGCTFPDCTAPATWCEAHHITPWHQGGHTNLDNAALLCSRHHTLLHHSEWHLTLTNGTPWYTPPWTIDRTQTPRRNNYHHGLSKNNA